MASRTRVRRSAWTLLWRLELCQILWRVDVKQDTWLIDNQVTGLLPVDGRLGALIPRQVGQRRKQLRRDAPRVAHLALVDRHHGLQRLRIQP